MFSKIERQEWRKGEKRKENKGYTEHYGESRAETVGVGGFMAPYITWETI